MVNIPLGLEAKNRLCKLATEMDNRLKIYWDEEIATNFGFEDNQRRLIKRVLEHTKEHNLRSAKRLRASFVYYGYLLGGEKPNEEVYKVMEGIEFVQTALLMHDDFMDEDKLRRGLPTTHEFFAEGDKHYGDSMAVNVGDMVLCLGYERVLQCNLSKERVLEAGRVLMRGILETAYGQIYDVTLPKLGEITEDKVLAVHRAKTSIYTFQNPLIIGGILAGLDEEALNILRDYSYKGGVAFQLQDDVLGVFGNSEKTGKSTDSDLLQGKSTLLIAKTFELGSEQQRQDLLAVWGNKKASKQEILRAKTAIRESGSLEYSLYKAKTLAKEAVEIADSLVNKKLNLDAINYLKGIAEYIVSREV